ncbi:MAG TPA: serine hydrolase [Clostridia bacterium]|nr:serine hydrolase [Clostridia bacterium]
MDITIQMRSVEMLVKFLKHDVANISPYGYALQKERFLPAAGTSVPLPRGIPEEQGVPSAALERFFADIGKEADELAVHGALVMRRGKVIAEGFFAPYRADVPHMLYSMSKTVTGMAVGIAVDEGFLSLDERLIDIFPEYTNAAQAKILRAHTVWNLLTMSSGSRFNEVGSMLDQNWDKMFMESIPKFEAGSAFEYNSMNSYMLAAILRRRTGMTLTEFLAPRLYEPLGIARYEWEKCPQGVEKGGWGLSLTLEDAAKLGQLYLNRGVWNGRRILSEKWCANAIRAQIKTPNGELKHGYGYQMWLADGEGSFQFNGAFGQYVVCMPKYEALVAIYGGSANLFAFGTLGGHIQRLFSGVSPRELPENPEAHASLTRTLGALRFEPSIPAGLGTDAEEFRRIAEMLDGREYALDNNTGGLFPQTLQAVHGNFTAGCDMLRFEKREQGLLVYFYEHEERNALLLRPDGSLADGWAVMKGEVQLTGTRALWKLAPGEIKLIIVSSFIETPDTRMFSIDIRQNKLHIVFGERPSLGRVVDMLFELVGISQVAYIKRMLSEMRREHVENLVRSMTVPEATGTQIKHNDEMGCNPTP